MMMMMMMDEGTFIIKSFVSTSNSSVFAIVMNYALISALLAFVIAQLAKFFITWCNERRWDAKILIGSGGMPSSHSATVAALATTVGFENGFQGSTFAIATALILASVVMYDALGVRLHAGRQAKVLNQIVYELPAEHPLSESRPLRELLGHTPLQVLAGAILGIFIAVVVHLIKIVTTHP